jgi:hypothetical protein
MNLSREEKKCKSSVSLKLLNLIARKSPPAHESQQQQQPPLRVDTNDVKWQLVSDQR